MISRLPSGQAQYKPHWGTGCRIFGLRTGEAAAGSMAPDWVGPRPFLAK
jgi:hypothetical protein